MITELSLTYMYFSVILEGKMSPSVKQMNMIYYEQKSFEQLVQGPRLKCRSYSVPDKLIDDLGCYNKILSGE